MQALRNNPSRWLSLLAVCTRSSKRQSDLLTVKQAPVLIIDLLLKSVFFPLTFAALFFRLNLGLSLTLAIGSPVKKLHKCIIFYGVGTKLVTILFPS